MRGLRLLKLAVCLVVLSSLPALSGCGSAEWPQFRNNFLRDGVAYGETVLDDPTKVSTLHVTWTFAPPGSLGFRASPIVSGGRVYIGDGSGYFYSLDATTGTKLWQYPLPGQLPLTQQFGQCLVGCNPSALGIAASGAITNIGGASAIVFAAPDPSPSAPGGPSSSPPLGDGHIFALNASTGALIWESKAVAFLDGTMSGCPGSPGCPNPNERHQQTGYSSPFVFNNRAYIGIADHDDDPIQQGNVVAVKLADGSIDTNFTFVADPHAYGGGGVWGSLAGWPGSTSNDVFVSTGNSDRIADPNNHGLSMLRLDDTGNIVWKHQPVPVSLDADADWAAGPAIAFKASCGAAVVSTQKDGWTWAVKVDPDPSTAWHAHVLWAFPPGPWTSVGFTPGDGTFHGNTDYKRPGVAWGDTYIGTMGGWQTQSDLQAGYYRLHALNICAANTQRVRWVKDIPGTTFYDANGRHGTYALGPPTITLGGMVFVGTNQGHVVAIADPMLRPAMVNRCEDPTYPSNSCPRRLVPDPWIRDIVLPAATTAANTYGDGIAGEVVILDGAIYVATISGHVYKLQP
jgi:outer membrane protein assembly factor BamB